MDHKEIIGESVSILRDRGAQYGDMESTVIRACEIYELITGAELSPYHANIFLHALKLSRIRTAPGKLDSYVDGINYLAFAGQFATNPAGLDSATAIVNAGMRDLVDQLNTQEV